MSVMNSRRLMIKAVIGEMPTRLNPMIGTIIGGWKKTFAILRAPSVVSLGVQPS
jgi:hypothetical protein